MRHLLFVLALSAAPVFAQEMVVVPEGKGKNELVETCARCHPLERVLTVLHSADEWSDILARMRTHGAKASEADFETIQNYLVRNFRRSGAVAAGPVTAGARQAGAAPRAQVAARSVGAKQDCCTAPGADFPKAGGNLGNQNYSSLAKIDTRNIAQLGAAWQLDLEPHSDAQSQQSTLVAAGGMLYAETYQGRVFAIDGMTGALRWTYAHGYGSSTRRGVTVAEGKVFTAAPGRHVIALDQRTGKLVWDKVIDEPSIGMQLKTAIVYYDGMLYLGSADGAGMAFGLRADSGDVVWKFQGKPPAGEFGNDTWEKNDAPAAFSGYGAAPWMHPAIDPQLGLVYWTMGNAREGGAVNGALRGGTNLFANSLVALDLKTGRRKWHFQSVHHDIWDMDNVMAPVLVDVHVQGVQRKAVVYGSKTALTYILDRTDGSPLIGIEERPVPQEATQKTWPTQPYPIGDPLVPICADANAKDATRAPPHYKVGCLFTPHTDVAVVMSPGTGGGADWSAQSFSPRTGLVYIPAGIVNSAHSIPTGGIGFRPAGQERSGLIVAKDPATNRIVWKRDMPWALAHGNGILTTAGNLMFIGQPDGYLLGLDIADGHELWRFQTGAGVHTSPITYSVGGEQYVAVLAGGNWLPYNSQPGSLVWAFRLGGTLPPAAAPRTPSMRQPVVGEPVDGTVTNNTVTLARTWSGAKSLPNEAESAAANAMAPPILRVPVGSTVTFLNPSGNSGAHCATQFFEGLFDFGPLRPGESARHTFMQAGEYFFNDCVTPQTTGMIIVTAPAAGP